MAWLAVNKDGTECISPTNPGRDYPVKGEWSDWEDSGGEYVFTTIPLPKGSIEKLIGRQLTWEGEPVEIK